MKKVSFNITENELNETLLKLYKLIAEMIKNILMISDVLNDINTTAIRITLAFDHHFLRINVYYNCKTRARVYVKLFSHY